MLLDWINDELAENRIIVQNLEEDLFDGQILQKLIGNQKAFYMMENITTHGLCFNKAVLPCFPLFYISKTS